MKSAKNRSSRQPNRKTKRAIRKLPKSKYCEHKLYSDVDFHSSLNFQNSDDKPGMISPLKELLTDCGAETIEKPEPKPCGYVDFNEEEKGELQTFKVFREKDVPLFTQEVTDVFLNEPGCDNDYLTDNEQIERATQLVQAELRDVLKNFKDKIKEARNIKRFGCNRSEIRNKRRIL